MRQVRGSATESGVLAAGGADVLGFLTTWGNGLFDVDVDAGVDGRAVAVRVVFEPRES